MKKFLVQLWLEDIDEITGYTIYKPGRTIQVFNGLPTSDEITSLEDELVKSMSKDVVVVGFTELGDTCDS